MRCVSSGQPHADHTSQVTMALPAGMMDVRVSQHRPAHSILTIGISALLSVITDLRASIYPSLLNLSSPSLSKDAYTHVKYIRNNINS